MIKPKYEKPVVLEHRPITFETVVSGGAGGSFPGTGGGVNGDPGKKPGEFPGGGATGGTFPGKGRP
ncbi:hypothetical protein [Paenibacillus harenae]|uniref:Lasso RiPP family leader peptide-containing protein n=1 Tax=Paenibacillus harenae TaxID=306543 RepID=A0ABT9UA26_PAEHA|nr:hypothetical protein [Paenibacillus harenae]MDQ0059031.1 hypothetical protein [Paenibacillus harenae]MDQ0115555.1 hypothetical protein [Paenibacillus harenae]